MHFLSLFFLVELGRSNDPEAAAFVRTLSKKFPTRSYNEIRTAAKDVYEDVPENVRPLISRRATEPRQVDDSQEFVVVRSRSASSEKIRAPPPVTSKPTVSDFRHMPTDKRIYYTRIATQVLNDEIDRSTPGTRAQEIVQRAIDRFYEASKGHDLSRPNDGIKYTYGSMYDKYKQLRKERIARGVWAEPKLPTRINQM